jgi:hypothetical protein
LVYYVNKEKSGNPEVDERQKIEGKAKIIFKKDRRNA